MTCAVLCGRAPGFALALVLALASAASAAIPVPPGAFAESALEGGEPRLTARLLVHPDDVGSTTLRLGVYFEMDPGWHLYWRNPGESGLPPVLEWRGLGAAVGPVTWAGPRVFRESEGEITTYGYVGETLLGTTARLDPEHEGLVAFEVDVDALVCETQCVPATFTLTREIDPDRAPPRSAPDAAVRAIFARHEAAQPRPAGEAGVRVEAIASQSAVRPGDAFEAALAVWPCGGAARCGLAAPAAEAIAFFPYAAEPLEIVATGVQPHPADADAFVVTLRGRAQQAPFRAAALQGVLALAGPDGQPVFVEIDRALPAAPAGAEVTRAAGDWIAASLSGPGPGLLRVLLLALLGGLILNLMPCVLPVLALKVVALAELPRGRRDALAHAGAYAAGIGASMLALAVVALGLRAAGTAVGWGFQLQEPAFVAVLAAVLVVFAANLFGVFEIQIDTSRIGALGQSSAGPARSFFDGLLAVALATPCSAPFLGTAVGFAFASPAPLTLLLFLAIGVGLAAPFVLAALVPGVQQRIPRAGPWMIELRRGLGFALLLTVAWLLWVLGRSTDSDGVAGVVVLLVLAATVSWLFGLLQRARQELSVVVLVVALAAGLAAGLSALDLSARTPQADAASAELPNAQPFSPTTVAAELGRGRAVFVYFTADWCITCKVNESRVLDDPRVLAELERLDVATLKADWTRRDESIRRALAELGKAGVPTYVVYSPAAPDQPTLLPELLTVERLLGALRAAADVHTAAR